MGTFRQQNCPPGVRALIVALIAFYATVALAATGDRLVTKVETTKVPAKVQYQLTREVGPGRIRKAKGGADGIIKRTYVEHVRSGKVISKKLVNVVSRKPVDALFLMGRGGFEPNRSSFTRSTVRTMNATGYPANVCGTGRTCTGRRAAFGCIAVDPRVIPLGTLMYVEGYGFGLACDRGSAIKGNRIDLCFASTRMADEYGRKNVKVHILKAR
jgi:3D (Asp-Asp-Asp) domain-containing protein